MANKNSDAALGLLGLLMALGGGAALLLVLLRQGPPEPAKLPKPSPAPRPPNPPAQPVGNPSSGDQAALAKVLAASKGLDQDIEAAARMLASENPRGSEQLHVEQVWTQIRAANPKQGLYERITADTSGYGPQGERAPGGKKNRPVASENPATDAFRQLAREVLHGKRPSSLPGARQFWEPAEQDKVFAIAERGREKQKRGEPLSTQEQKLLKYHDNAEGIRQRWSGEQYRLVGVMGPLEFWT